MRKKTQQIAHSVLREPKGVKGATPNSNISIAKPVTVHMYNWFWTDGLEDVVFDSADDAIKSMAHTITLLSKEHLRLYKKLNYIEKLAKAK